MKMDKRWRKGATAGAGDDVDSFGLITEIYS